MDFNLYTAASVLAVLTLLTTLKLTLTSRVTVGADKKHFILFHPIWLGALVVEVPYVIGKYLDGGMSPCGFQPCRPMRSKWVFGFHGVGAISVWTENGWLRSAGGA